MSLFTQMKRLAPFARPVLATLCSCLLVALPLAATRAEPVVVAETPPADGPVAEKPATSAEAYAEFKRLFDAGDRTAAVEAARTVVALAEQEEAADSEPLQVALMNLGLAQQMAGDYLGAEASYLRVIALIEAAGRPASPRLARSHAGVATAYHSARRYDLAIEALDRAVGLSRRTEGLFNEEQLPLLAKQVDSLTQLGRLEEALQAQRYALRVVARKYGDRSLRYAQQLEAIGRWYALIGAYDGARTTLVKALDLVQELEGPASIQLVGPLTALADNAQRWIFDPQARGQAAGEEERRSMFHDPSGGMLPGLAPSTIAAEGQRSLERAVTIVDAVPQPPPDLVAAVRTQLGDWHQARRQTERAMPHYLLAWQAATQAPPDGKPLQEQLFGAPVLVQYTAPEGWDRYAKRPPEEAERRYVELELTVTAQGEASDVKLRSDAGDARFAQRTVEALQAARYRPRFEAGQPVATSAVPFLQPGHFLLEKTPQAPAAPDGAARTSGQ